MAKLYFRYGTVSSAKTLNLLAVAHNYENQGKRAVVLKPSVDTRHPEGQAQRDGFVEFPRSLWRSREPSAVHAMPVDRRD